MEKIKNLKVFSFERKIVLKLTRIAKNKKNP